MRFHLDEQISPALAVALRRKGIDVSTSQDAALLGSGDLDQLSFAISEQRILVTFDDDFLRLDAEGVHHCGICYCHPRKYSTIGELLHVLLIVAECSTEDEMRNHVEYL
jgi:hypothetical protein